MGAARWTLGGRSTAGGRRPSWRLTARAILAGSSILLTVISAFLVVLALVAQGVGFDRSLLGLATCFAVASLVLGSLTALRVGLASQEDAELIRGMNRLRAAYVELAPEIRPHLTASTHDDRTGLMATYTLGNRRPLLAHVVGSTSFFLIVINTMVAATLGGLVAAWARGSTAVVVGAAVVAALAWFAAQTEVTRRLFGPELQDVRFPAPD